jgi:hypothetical protein
MDFTAHGFHYFPSLGSFDPRSPQIGGAIKSPIFAAQSGFERNRGLCRIAPAIHAFGLAILNTIKQIAIPPIILCFFIKSCNRESWREFQKGGKDNVSGYG